VGEGKFGADGEGPKAERSGGIKHKPEAHGHTHKQREIHAAKRAAHNSITSDWLVRIVAISAASTAAETAGVTAMTATTTMTAAGEAAGTATTTTTAAGEAEGTATTTTTAAVEAAEIATILTNQSDVIELCAALLAAWISRILCQANKRTPAPHCVVCVCAHAPQVYA